jgi:benzylsuccinate CoA-transferase BbsE subunit
MTTIPEGALHGRRVLELADETGVYCGKLLADMGADVLKIERPGGDETRDIPPFLHDEPGADRGLFFLYMNTSKRGLTLDLERPEGQALFRRLATTADLVVETLPPGRLDALGVGQGSLREANPRLVVTSITGFGQTGPYCHYRSSDLVAAALGGAMYVTGAAEDPPVRLAGHQACVTASTCAAASSVIAMLHASLTGAGQHVDISMEEATVAATHICGVGKWLDDGIVARRAGTSLFNSTPSGTYRCRDGLVYLMVNRPLHWQALARWVHEVTGNDGILDPLFEGPSSRRQAYRDILDGWIGELTARLTVDEVYREGQRRHLAVTPVSTAGDVVSDAHLAARGYFADLGPLRYPGAPYRLSETPWRLARPAPRVGEHNDEVYRGELGLSAGDCAALARRGVI